jgi:hypothetical protein
VGAYLSALVRPDIRPEKAERLRSQMRVQVSLQRIKDFETILIFEASPLDQTFTGAKTGDHENRMLQDESSIKLSALALLIIWHKLGVHAILNVAVN